MNLIELQNKIHEQNKSVGWWDEPRDFSTFTNLFHSEASEALEGDRKGLMDDKLKHHKMVPVESADCAIRILDYLGYIENDQIKLVKIHIKGRFQYNLAHLHYYLSQAWYERMLPEPNEGIVKRHLIMALSICVGIIKEYGHDPVELILEKVEFNLTRADHQRENRAKEGGKKY